MDKLHLICQNLERKTLEKSFDRYVLNDESLLFIADSVTNLLNQDIVDFLRRSNTNCYALQADCKLRGINKNIPSFVSLVSDSEMVNLIVNSKQTISW